VENVIVENVNVENAVVDHVFVDGLETMTVAGIPTIRATRTELAALMVHDHACVRSGSLSLPRVLVSSNGMVIAKFHRDPAFRSLILQAHIVDADGMPLVIASRFLCRKPLAERVATTDFIQDAASTAAASGIRFYFLGGRPGVAQQAASKLELAHPGLQIAGTHDGYFCQDEETSICADIRRRHTDVLWVGLGSPKQEAFVIRNRRLLSGLTWLRTCGGLFDHLAGRFRRAPRYIQWMGLEWMYRAWQEPMRLGPRYISTNPVAAYHLLTKTHD
jgi:N-acetylglucosaminyldiphosphoundecaprenol N-acetyl-beta-D-mannosaminyltransferase